MPVTVRYYFSQHFPVYAQEAFAWCTAFDEGDYKLMGDKTAERQVTRVSEGTLILKDTFQTAAGAVEKQKIVQLYPDKHTWTSTHLTGPNKYSQFLYQITPQGKGACVLNFTALHLEYDEKVVAKVLAAHLCREDADAWKLLAKAMAEEQTK